MLVLILAQILHLHRREREKCKYMLNKLKGNMKWDWVNMHWVEVYFIACSSKTQGQTNNQSYPIIQKSFHYSGLWNLWIPLISCFTNTLFLPQTASQYDETRLDILFCTFFLWLWFYRFYSRSHRHRCQIKFMILVLLCHPFSPPSLKNIHYCNRIRQQTTTK